MNRRLQLCAVLLGTGLIFTGCGKSEQVTVSAEDGQTLLENATAISLEGDLDDIVVDTDIRADGQAAGHVQERGFWDSKWTVSTGEGESWFYLRYVTDEPINEDTESYVTGSTYGYYDMEDHCLGYAQERVLETDTLSRGWYLTFLDGEGNPKEYLADEEASRIFDYEGNVIATGSFFFGGFLNSDKYTIEVAEKAGSALQMDFMDKMCVFLKINQKVNSDYGD